jgi:hypothetical protein
VGGFPDRHILSRRPFWKIPQRARSPQDAHVARSPGSVGPRRQEMSNGTRAPASIVDAHGEVSYRREILVCPSVIREVPCIRTGAVPRLKWTMYRRRPSRPIKREPSLCILDSVFIFNTLVFSPLVALRSPIRTAKSPTFYC